MQPTWTASTSVGCPVPVSFLPASAYAASCPVHCCSPCSGDLGGTVPFPPSLKLMFVLERISSWALLNRSLFSLQMLLQYPVPSLCHPLEDRRMRISGVPVTCKQLENSCVKKSNHAAWAQRTRASQQPAVALCSPHGNWCQILPLVICVLLSYCNKFVALQLPHVNGKMQIFPVQIKRG